jgi:hypothetical protein
MSLQTVFGRDSNRVPRLLEVVMAAAFFFDDTPRDAFFVGDSSGSSLDRLFEFFFPMLEASVFPALAALGLEREERRAG